MQMRLNIKNNQELSLLGLGCMKFPQKSGNIDFEKSKMLVDFAVKSGVNYFDTAYIYNFGKNEAALGKIISELGIRDKINIATKLPLFRAKTNLDLDKIFNLQLERLQTDRIDYYLMHMLSDINTWERLCSIGIIEWIEQKKKSGQIINIGFSFHGNRSEFPKLIDSYNWDFCMIQYNYLDTNNQAGKSGLLYAAQKELPIFIMEPLRGGHLVDQISPKAKEIFKKENPNRSLAEWGLRWVMNHKEVTCVLSGMNTLEQLKENINTASDCEPDSLSEKELLTYDLVLDILHREIKVNCTGCGYCMPCPVGVDIPTCFNFYNEQYMFGRMNSIAKYAMATGVFSADTPSNASRCIKCRKCEKHCPQSIKIADSLTNVAKELERFPFFIISKIARKFMRIKSKKSTK